METKPDKRNRKIRTQDFLFRPVLTWISNSPQMSRPVDLSRDTPVDTALSLHSPNPALISINYTVYLYLTIAQPPVGQGPLIIENSRSHSVWRTTVSRTPLDEWSAPRKDLYITTHNTQKIHASMLRAELEPATPAGERTQTHTVVRAATVTGTPSITPTKWTVLTNTHIKAAPPTRFDTTVCAFFRENILPVSKTNSWWRCYL